jgi:hypothetical protein
MRFTAALRMAIHPRSRCAKPSLLCFIRRADIVSRIIGHRSKCTTGNRGQCLFRLFGIRTILLLRQRQRRRKNGGPPQFQTGLNKRGSRFVLSQPWHKNKDVPRMGAPSPRVFSEIRIAGALGDDFVVAQQAAEIDDLPYVIGLVHGEKADHSADSAVKAGRGLLNRF